MECDGKLLELPEDIEGLLLLNINSYMGGVNLWASGAWQPGRHTTAKQSICDGKLEVSLQKLYRPSFEAIVKLWDFRRWKPREITFRVS